MPTNMNEMTLNEYIHEHTHTELSNGNCIVIYEPLENLPCNNLMGELYLGNPGRAPRPAGAFIGSFGHIRFQAVHFTLGPNPVLQGIFNDRTGVIRIRWDKYPGEHVLRISYEFGEQVVEAPREGGGAPLTINWLREGF